MKKRVLVIFAILMLVIVPMVLAVEINVKTLPGHVVTVFLRTPEAYDVLDFHQGKAKDGVINFESGFYQDLVDLQVNVGTSGGDNVIVVKKAGVSARGIIDLYLPSEQGALVTTRPLEGTEEVVEETEEVEVEETDSEEVVEDEVVAESPDEEAVEDSEEVTAGITGNAVDSIKGVFTSKASYYIIGAVLGLFALVFVIQVGRKKIEKGGNYKVVKYAGENDDKRLDAAERKLMEAKRELDEIKNRKKKLAEAKVRFEKDKEELSRLE